MITTSSSDAKLEPLKNPAANYAVNYHTTHKWREEVPKLLTTEASTLSLFDYVALRGLVNLIGYSTGNVDDAEDRTTMSTMALKGISF